MGAMLRYLPYIGPYFAAVLPVTITLALKDGWSSSLMVIGLFVILELVIANFIEPWLYGQSMGVSEIALLVSAALWAFLWGPIGLVLSSPLTVCLVMLGRYVPQLEFLAVLLGDEPALDKNVSFYQRLLARDQDEAEELVVERLKTDSPEQMFDVMLLPALSAAKENRVHGDITQADQEHVVAAIREIVQDAGERSCGATAALTEHSAAGPARDDAARPPIVIFGCPARDASDGVGLEMLETLLEPARWKLELTRTHHIDRRAARARGRPGTRPGLDRLDSTGRAGPHPLPLQAAPYPVPRASHPRGTLGRTTGRPGRRAAARGRRFCCYFHSGRDPAAARQFTTDFRAPILLE